MLKKMQLYKSITSLTRTFTPLSDDDEERERMEQFSLDFLLPPPVPQVPCFSSIQARMQYGVETSFKSRLQQYFIENHTSSLRIRIFNFFIKVLSCVLYAVRVIEDDYQLPDSARIPFWVPRESRALCRYIFWVDISYTLWLIQTVVAVLSIVETILIFYISYKGNVWRLLLNRHFLLEMVTSFPLIITIFVPEYRIMFVPAFLNCWLAKSELQAMLHDLNRVSIVNQSALSRQMVILFSTLICLLFTGACGFQHLQRCGERQSDLIRSFYFTMVTFSTVGYGDIYPDTWLSQLLVIGLIILMLLMLPQQLEKLTQTWLEKERSGGDLATGWGNQETHVVVTVTHLEVEFIKDFLTEFYAHPENQTVLVILLSPCELDNTMRMLLKIPLWAQRVKYVRGSALRDEDLERARVVKAKACFVLSARHVQKKITTDEHTILRSWAIKDFAPHVPQYVQIFRPETKMHLNHAEVCICEDELKYSLLANNCICPGISTFLTLLMHTSRGEEGQKSTEPWHKVYGFHSGNEIYDICVENSKFFGDFVGKSFTYASFHAHRAYGIGLIGVKTSDEGAKMRLNPGLTHIIQPSDTVYYMGLTNEESLYDFRKDLKNQRMRATLANTIANVGTVAMDVPHLEGGNHYVKKEKKKRLGILKRAKHNDEMRLIEVPNEDHTRRPSVGIVADENESSSSSNEEDENRCERCLSAGRLRCIQTETEKSFPKRKTYIGASPTICHVLKKKRELCCLQVDKPCPHFPYSGAHKYKWQNSAIILAADKVSSGMYNLIIPLRAYYRPVHDLRPIVVLIEAEYGEVPDPAFLDVISYFPDIYWTTGRLSSLDTLLQAGVCQSENVVVVRETAVVGEEHLADSNTIITVQKIHSWFPALRIVTELTHTSNMRFMMFNPHDPYSLQQSKFEKKERRRGSNMPYMFRLPFAQGGVFSANMLDRLLYQSIIKPYLVSLTRLFLGIDQNPGSGYLASFVITADDLWIKTYGRLYQKLCSSVADIPIGIFRTKKMDATTVSIDIEERCRSLDIPNTHRFMRNEVQDMVKNRMKYLDMSVDNTALERYEDKETMISYVLINPSQDLVLEAGDIVYVIRSPISENARNKKVNPRRGLRRSRQVTEASEPPPGYGSNQQMPRIVVP
ncbi:unnamed protein product, partial [Mesorhabditis spiculigera]